MSAEPAPAGRHDPLALPPQLDDLAAWPELSYAASLTDGLPVHPPLAPVVAELVAASGRDGDEVLGPIPPRDAEATVEAVAANTAMAGARPEHMSVILAALEAMLEPAFNLRGVQTTTHGCWPLVIVSGPAAAGLGMSSAESVFSGGGSRASAAIGRAVRLVLWNVGGSMPGEPVKEVFGHPGRYSFAIAEAQASPWPPLHEARGVDAASGVTVFACESPHSVAMWGCDDEPATRLGQVADAMAIRGSNNAHTMGEVLVCVTPSEARHLAARGYGRAEVQAELFARARRRLGDLRPRGPLRPDTSPEHWYSWWPDWVDQRYEDTEVPVVERPGDIHVVVTGADSIPWAAVCPGWGHLGGFAQSRALATARPLTAGGAPRGRSADGRAATTGHRLVDPRGRAATMRRHLAPRPGGPPRDARIGFLINEVSRQTGPDFTAYSHVLEQLLAERLGPITVHRDAKPVLSRPADRAMLDAYRDCRGVVSGLAK